MSQPNDGTPVAWIIGGIFVLLLVAQVISAVWFPLFPWDQERQAGQEAIEQTYDAEQAIQTYEEFRELHNDIEAQREKVANSYDARERFYNIQGKDPDEWSRTAETRHNRIQTRITANKQQLENLIAEYNSMTESANEELFKCHLPYQVDERLEIRGPPGSDKADKAIQDVGPDGEPVDPTAEVPEPENCDGLPDEIRQSASG